MPILTGALVLTDYDNIKPLFVPITGGEDGTIRGTLIIMGRRIV